MKKYIFILSFLWFLPFHTTLAQDAAKSTASCEGAPEKVVAEVYGRNITEAEVQKELSIDLYELQKNIYSLKKRKIDELIGNTLGESKADYQKKFCGRVEIGQADSRNI